MVATILVVAETLVGVESVLVPVIVNWVMIIAGIYVLVIPVGQMFIVL